MPPRHDSASEITLPRATSLLGATPPALGDDGLGDEITINRRVDTTASRWHVELELDPDQIARLYRLGLAHDAVVWRDGLADWRPLLQAQELRDAIDALKARAPSSMKSALRRATIDRITSMSRSSLPKSAAASPRRRANTDPALRLYAALNRRSTTRDTLEFTPAPKITTAPIQVAVAPVQRDSVAPAIAPVILPRPGRLAAFASHLGVALMAVALTASLPWLRAPRGTPAKGVTSQPALSAAQPIAHEKKPVPTPDVPISVQSLAVETTAISATSKPPEPKPKAEPKPAAVERAASPSTSNGPDRGKIARALAAAAGAAADCGVGGSARVVATFAPSGVLRRVAIEGPVPELTDRACVLRAIARARIPPFFGDPITVRKTVSF